MNADYKFAIMIIESITAVNLSNKLFVKFNCIYWTTGSQYDKMI